MFRCQMDRFLGRGPAYIAGSQRFWRRPGPSRHEIEDGEGDNTEHEQQAHGPDEPPNDVGEHVTSLADHAPAREWLSRGPELLIELPRPTSGHPIRGSRTFPKRR